MAVITENEMLTALMRIGRDYLLWSNDPVPGPKAAIQALDAIGATLREFRVLQDFPSPRFEPIIVPAGKPNTVTTWLSIIHRCTPIAKSLNTISPFVGVPEVRGSSEHYMEVDVIYHMTSDPQLIEFRPKSQEAADIIDAAVTEWKNDIFELRSDIPISVSNQLGKLAAVYNLIRKYGPADPKTAKHMTTKMQIEAQILDMYGPVMMAKAQELAKAELTAL